jgi:hypothetical protein
MIDWILLGLIIIVLAMLDSKLWHIKDNLKKILAELKKQEEWRSRN